MTEKFFDVEAFFEIVDDPGLFQFKQYNLFKVFYFAFEQRILISRLSNRSNAPRRDFKWMFNRPFVFIKALIKATFLGISRRGTPQTLLYKGLREDHVARLIDDKGRHRFIVIQDHRDSEAQHGDDSLYHSDIYLHDFAVPIAQFYVLVRLVFAGSLRKFAETIVSQYADLGFDRDEIVSKVTLFYAKLLTYRLLLTVLRPERAILISHYGKEAFIAACKHRRIPVTELMHGALIAHPQYNFPVTYQHLFRRALFPDKLSVFGEYWKQIAVQGNMFPEDAILVGGYHLKTPDKATDEVRALLPPDKSVIMISGQGVLVEELRNYINFLKCNLDPSDWYIVIKPHPNRDPTVYDSVLEPGFVTVTNASPYQLLSLVDVHISLYSTLLYEAVRYRVSNYVLLLDGSPNICREIIKSGVALPLRPDQLPEVDKGLDDLDAQFYFADFRPWILLGEKEESTA